MIEFLQELNELGLPLWVVVVLVLVMALHYTGALESIEKIFTARQAERRSTENSALDIAKETIDWSRQEFSEQQKELQRLREAVEKSTRVEEQRAKLLTLQNGILSELRSDIQRYQTKIVMIAELLEKQVNGKPNSD